MRSKFGFLVSNSLKKKIKSKWFLVANIAIAILLIGILNIDSIISLFGGDFDKKVKMYVVDEVGSLDSLFESSMKSIDDINNQSYELIFSTDNYDSIKDTIEKEKTNDILIRFYKENDSLQASLTTLSNIEALDYQLINTVISNTVKTYNIYSLNLTEDDLNKVIGNIEIERIIIDESITSEDENVSMIMTTIFPVIIMPFFLLTIFLVQFIGSEVNDEKTTKSMEIIISSVSPGKHFGAKIISNNLFVIFQAILMFLYGGMGLLIKKIIGTHNTFNGVGETVSSYVKTIVNTLTAEKFVPIVIATIVLMILTFIGYSLVAGILASMTTSAEDYQHIQAPIVIVLLLGYYLSIMAGMFNGSYIIKILSFCPFISAILSPSLMVLGQIGLINVIISSLIMAAFDYLLIKYGMKIYKAGVLNYSSSNLWKKIWVALKSKG